MDKEIFSNRTAVYEAARQKNPNHWSGETRNWSLKNEVWLNPEMMNRIQVEKQFSKLIKDIYHFR